MKKLIIAACLLLGVTGFASAQEAVKKNPAKVTKMEKVKPATAGTSVTEGAAARKADGTPDRRFKMNKDKMAAGPVKKDGTLDRRYKLNKKKPDNH